MNQLTSREEGLEHSSRHCETNTGNDITLIGDSTVQIFSIKPTIHNDTRNSTLTAIGSARTMEFSIQNELIKQGDATARGWSLLNTSRICRQR